MHLLIKEYPSKLSSRVRSIGGPSQEHPRSQRRIANPTTWRVQRTLERIRILYKFNRVTRLPTIRHLKIRIQHHPRSILIKRHRVIIELRSRASRLIKSEYDGSRGRRTIDTVVHTIRLALDDSKITCEDCDVALATHAIGTETDAFALLHAGVCAEEIVGSDGEGKRQWEFGAVGCCGS